MAVYLVILGLLFALIIGSFIFSRISGNQIFLLTSFLLLMFSGVLIQSSGGIIVDTQIVPDVDNGGWANQNVIVGLEDSFVYLFSQACFWIGLALSAWTGLVMAFVPSKNNSPNPFNY